MSFKSLNRLRTTLTVSSPEKRLWRNAARRVFQCHNILTRENSHVDGKRITRVARASFSSQEPAGQDRYRDTEIPRCTMHKVQFSSLPRARSKIYFHAYSRTTCALQRKRYNVLRYN
ncbi:hypothetical protein PUN28_018333 [Cardiocondyla obscurior]|uniref:Uncharacterized protein n=1 Tax=Cardiocondyla obscurior TaxID=286306 RepID=A0AAW2EJ58_9HYME